ncbi:TPA: hypothetical protein ACRZGX_001773 [Escherichia coli]
MANHANKKSPDIVKYSVRFFDCKEKKPASAGLWQQKMTKAD